MTSSEGRFRRAINRIFGSESPDPPEREKVEPEVSTPLEDAFTQRYAVIIRLRDDRHDIKAAMGAFQKCGWPAESEDRTVDPECRDNQTVFRVEVRPNGSVIGSGAEAERQLAEALKGIAHVEISQITHVTPNIEPREIISRWHMHKKPTWGNIRGLGTLSEIWIATGCADTRRTITLRGPGSKSTARSILAQDSRGGVAYDPRKHEVRAALGPAIDTSNPTDQREWRRAIAFGAFAAAVMAYGFVMGLLPLPARLAAGVVPLAASVIAGKWLTSRERRPLIVEFGVGLISVGSGITIGMIISQEERSESKLLVSFPVAVAVLLVLRGCWHAIRHSPISRNAIGIASLLIAPLPLVLPGAGRFVEYLYLREGFGIPRGAVSVETYWTYIAGLQPVAWCASVILCLLAIVGWSRHFYSFKSGQFYASVVVAIMAVVYILTGIIASMKDADDAASKAAEAARTGKQPSPYYGIAGHRVCVTPTVSNPSVKLGPLPIQHPVLVFETSGSELWMWDPKRKGGLSTVHVPASQVSTRHAPEGTQSCLDGQPR